MLGFKLDPFCICLELNLNLVISSSAAAKAICNVVLVQCARGVITPENLAICEEKIDSVECFPGHIKDAGIKFVEFQFVCCFVISCFRYVLIQHSQFIHSEECTLYLLSQSVLRLEHGPEVRLVGNGSVKAGNLGVQLHRLGQAGGVILRLNDLRT